MVLRNSKHTNELVEDIIIPNNIIGKKYYLYVHYRLDKNEPFYIGTGTLDYNKYYYRALSRRGRNNIWHKITTKTKYDIFIIEESDNKQDILNREIQYIALFGRKSKNGILSNLTDGGEGHKGVHQIWTEEARNKIRIANSKRVIKDSTREKLRLALKKRGIINKPNGNKKTK